MSAKRQVEWWEVIVSRRGSRISARGGRQGNDDLIWDGNERFFDICKQRFATFQDVYCHIMPEWCLTTIQETPVFLLSALETREPAPSARVLPSQGWAPAPAPPPGSAPGKADYIDCKAWAELLHWLQCKIGNFPMLFNVAMAVM